MLNNDEIKKSYLFYYLFIYANFMTALHFAFCNLRFVMYEATEVTLGK